MAKKVKRKNVRGQKKAVKVSPFNIYWTKRNYMFLFLGMAVLVLGFYLMSIGPWNSFVSLVLSPIVLVIGYVFIFPMAILYKGKKEENLTEEKTKQPEVKQNIITKS